MGNFSFTFPSLSLQTYATADDVTPATSEAGDEGVEEAQRCDDVDDAPPPSKLLSRTQSVSDKDAIRDSSEAMAHNVLESFGAALVWRAKTWIKSLANVLALKEQERINALRAPAAAAEGEGRIVINSGDMEAHREEGKGNGAEAKELGPEGFNQNDDLMNSKEMQIIDAIVKSSEEVSVVNVKIAFRVLPNMVSQQWNDDPDHGLREPSPKKKAKMAESTQGKPKEYKVTHKLVFEATVSMTSNDGVRYNGVQLQAPGYIQGTFSKNNPGPVNEGEETLSGVFMTLDTDALALSLERQSRLVVRQAAEAALMAANGIQASSSPRYMESPHVHHSVTAPPAPRPRRAARASARCRTASAAPSVSCCDRRATPAPPRTSGRRCRRPPVGSVGRAALRRRFRRRRRKSRGRRGVWPRRQLVQIQRGRQLHRLSFPLRWLVPCHMRHHPPRTPHWDPRSPRPGG